MGRDEVRTCIEKGSVNVSLFVFVEAGVEMEGDRV